MVISYIYQVEKGCLRADVACGGDVDVLDIQQVASKFNTTYTAYEQDGANPITAVDVMLVANQKHHIVTNRNWVRDPQWTKSFKELFDKGGPDLDDAINKVD